jgi:ABC-type antimicrobial peptide transport system permease subunit
MFIIHLIQKNVMKHWKKSILSVLISIVIILFLLLYLQNIESNQTQLIKLGQTIPVTGRVSNIDGSQVVGLEIGFDKVHQVLDTNMITDAVITAQAYARETDATELDRMLPPPIIIIGANTFSAFTAFSTEDVTFTSSYDESYLTGNEEVCVLRDAYLQEQNLKLGEEFELEMYAPKYNGQVGSSFTYEWMGVKRLKIIGSYTTDANILSEDLPYIITPMSYIEHIYDGSKEKPNASSMRFTLKEPLKINVFKSAMQQIGFVSVNISGGASHIGKAISMNDQTFILAATQLKESLTMLKSLAPLIFIIVAVIGYIASYLLMQSRQNEFAIMRSLGTDKKRCFIIIFLESLMLALIGSILGTVGALIIVDVSPLMTGVILGSFLITYLLGTAIALFLLNRFSVMAILTKTD